MGGPGSGHSNKPITRNRPKTRWFCHWRPNRTVPRKFTPTDAARVFCATLENGHTVAEIETKIKLKCGEKVPVRDPVSGNRPLEAEARIQLELNNEFAGRIHIILEIITVILLGAGVAARVVPALRPFTFALIGARAEINGLIIEGQAIRISNQNLIEELNALGNLRTIISRETLPRP